MLLSTAWKQRNASAVQRHCQSVSSMLETRPARNVVESAYENIEKGIAKESRLMIAVVECCRIALRLVRSIRKPRLVKKPWPGPKKSGGKAILIKEQHTSSLETRYAMDGSKSLSHVPNVALLNLRSTATMMITPSPLRSGGYVRLATPSGTLNTQGMNK